MDHRLLKATNLLKILDSGWWWWVALIIIFGFIPTFKFSLGIFKLQFHKFVQLESSSCCFKFNWCFRAVLSSWTSWGEEVGNAEESPSQMQTKGGGWSPVKQFLNSRPAWLLLLFSLLLRQQFGCKFSYGLICSVLEYSLLLGASTLSLQEGWAWSFSSGLRVSSSGMKSAWCCESEKHHLEPPVSQGRFPWNCCIPWFWWPRQSP